MMALILPWWRDRSRREQWLVGIMVVMLSITVSWLGIMRPLAAARESAELRLAAAVDGLAAVKGMTGPIRTAEARAASTRSIPLVEAISQRASEAGLSVEAMQAAGDGRVTLRIAAVRPPAILRWLGDLEARDGIVIDHVGMNRNADATIAVDLMLRRGGR